MHIHNGNHGDGFICNKHQTIVKTQNVLLVLFLSIYSILFVESFKILSSRILNSSPQPLGYVDP